MPLRKAIITLIIVAFMFSMLSILTGTGLHSITSRTIQNDIPTFFSFLTVVSVIAIITLVLLDLIIFVKIKKN